MTTEAGRDVPEALVFPRYGASGTVASALAMLFALAGTGEARRENFCSQTARTLFAACKAEATDDILVRKAICINISDSEEREKCFDDSKTEAEETKDLCREQRGGRLDTCKSLGGGRS